MSYTQSQLPVQTYIQGADFVATEVFSASADLVILQALPQTQNMNGTANGGYEKWSDSGRNYAVAVSLYAFKNIYDYVNIYTTLPASGEMGANQTATGLQTPNMFLQMKPSCFSGWFLEHDRPWKSRW